MTTVEFARVYENEEEDILVTVDWWQDVGGGDTFILTGTGDQD